MKHKSRGFSTVLVVVLIVVFGLMGGYMSTQITTSIVMTSASFGGMQGWSSARSASEWATWQVLYSGTGCGSFPASFTIDSFSINITCSSSAVSEGPDNYTVYDLVTTAERGSQGEISYIYRAVRSSVTDGL
jgi:hypothetical protein